MLLPNTFFLADAAVLFYKCRAFVNRDAVIFYPRVVSGKMFSALKSILILIIPLFTQAAVFLKNRSDFFFRPYGTTGFNPSRQSPGITKYSHNHCYYFFDVKNLAHGFLVKLVLFFLCPFGRHRLNAYQCCLARNHRRCLRPNGLITGQPAAGNQNT